MGVMDEKKISKGAEAPSSVFGGAIAKERGEQQQRGGGPSTPSQRIERESGGAGEGTGRRCLAVPRPNRPPSEQATERERESGSTTAKGGRYRQYQALAAALEPSTTSKNGGRGRGVDEFSGGSQSATRAAPKRPKSNPKMGPLVWIRGGFPHPPIYG